MRKYIYLLMTAAVGCSIHCITSNKYDTLNQPIINQPESSTVITSSELKEKAQKEETKEVITTSSKCKDGMVEVNGEYCPNLLENCLKWGDPKNPGVNGPVQCLEFQYPTQCLSDKTIHMDYCIDRLPYPYNTEEKPGTNMTWYTAKHICESQGKRLCSIREYTQACRGPENKPYPYGYTRQCDLCNCDRTPWLDPKTHTFEELDKRIPIKDIMSCKSDYGVIGLVGNADRWVYNERERPYKSALVGGHSIKGARNRCSAVTLAHNEASQYYEFGDPLCCDSVKE